MATDTSSRPSGQPRLPHAEGGTAVFFGKKLGLQTLELLLPTTCRLCDRCIDSGKDFCVECDSKLTSSEHLTEFSCLRCGRPGAGPPGAKAQTPLSGTLGSEAQGAPPASEKGCQGCRKQTLHFDSCIPLWTYDGLVRKAIIASKYGSQVALADALGRRLALRIIDVMGFGPESSDCERPADFPDIVAAVPSHLWRRIQRGSGGSRVLASSVAGELGRYGYEAAYRTILAATRPISKQAWLGERERVMNVQGAFRVTNPRWRSRKRLRLQGKHVLLVDDVMTTGATASEIAGVLKEAGAERVTVAVVARAVGG